MTNIIINGIDLTTPKTVLLIVKDDLTYEEMNTMKRILDENVPNTKFVMLQGDFQAFVVENDTHYEIEA